MELNQTLKLCDIYNKYQPINNGNHPTKMTKVCTEMNGNLHFSQI